MSSDDRLGDAISLKRLHDLECAHGVEMLEDASKFRCSDPMYGTSRCRELYVVTTRGGEVDLGPVDQFAIDTLSEEWEVQPMEDSAEPDVDSVDLPSAILVTGQEHIGHSGQSMPGDVDDLCVEHITYEEELIVLKMEEPLLELHPLRARIPLQNDRRLVETIDVMPVEKDWRRS